MYVIRCDFFKMRRDLGKIMRRIESMCICIFFFYFLIGFGVNRKIRIK